MLKVGDYELHSIDTGDFRLDGGAMFGVVPKVLWERTNPADEQNRIAMSARSLLIKGRGKVFLVDAGLGERWGDKQKKIYAIDYSTDKLDRALAKASVKREDVTDVLLTHLHFDHVGGLTREENGNVEPVFPNAKVYVQERQLKHAYAPTEKDRASFLEPLIRPLEAMGKLVTVNGTETFAPGISALLTEGHTPGHMMIKVTGGNSTVVATGDSIPTASHVPVPYVMGYDLHPVTCLEEKKAFLEPAAREGWLLFWVHDPFRPASTVKREGSRFSADKHAQF